MYFLEQLGSGHSSRTGDGGGLPQGAAGVGGGATLVFLLPGRGESSSPTRPFLLLDGSTLGGTNGVGEDGAVDGVDPLVLAVAPLRPLTAPPAPPPPFLSLLCTDDRVSVKLLRSVVGVVLAAERPRLPRPFGVRVSKSLVGESQNLHGRTSGKRNKK